MVISPHEWVRDDTTIDGHFVVAARVPASTIRVGDRVWTHNAFRLVTSADYDERSKTYMLMFAPLYEGDSAFGANQGGGHFVLRLPREDDPPVRL